MTTTREPQSNIDKLHAMLKEIGVESNVANLKEEGFELPSPSTFEKKQNGLNNEDIESSILEEEDEDSKRLMKSLEYDFEEEDSWLFKSPHKKHDSPERFTSPEKWIESGISTPELNRVKGCLANKLELIALENKKDKFESIVNKHNLRSSASSRQINEEIDPRSHDVETLDWEYDEDEKARSKVRRSKTRTIRKHYSYSHNAVPNAAYEDSVDAYDDAPFKLDFPDEECDDLQPMTLAFDAPASAPIIPKVSSKLRRTSSGGNSQRRVDKYDLAVDELVATPTGNIRPRPSKYQFDLSSNANSDSSKLLSYSDQSDAESVDSNFSDSLIVQPRGGAARNIATDESMSGGLTRPRARGREIPSPRGSNSNLSTSSQVKPRGLVRPRTSPASSDAGVRSRQSPASEVSGIIRPRGSGQSPASSITPVSRGMNRNGETKLASPSSNDMVPRSGLPQPRKSTGMVQPRGSLGIVKPRRSRSPEPTSRAIPRGSAAAVSRSAYAEI